MTNNIATTNLHAIDYEVLKKQLAITNTDAELFNAIVNVPFDYKVETAFFFLGIIVLLQVNKKDGTIERKALSNTELAKNTTEVSVVPFSEIKIPVDYTKNIIADAIASNEPRDTIDWRFLFEPALTAEEARINQASAGVAYSAVYPLKARDGGALIFSYYQYKSEIGQSQKDFMQKYSTLVDKQLRS